jgi:hypothetical protein
MADDALFPIPGGARVRASTTQNPAANATLGERQMAKLLRGEHPLTKPGWPVIRLHPDAPPPGDRTAPGPCCGTCRFREVLLTDGCRGKPVPKCVLPDRYGAAWRATHSDVSDVREWWPACRDYEAKPTSGAEETAG